MVHCLRMVASHFNYTGLTLLFRAVLSPLAIVRYHHTQRQYFIVPCKRWAVGPCLPADHWRDSGSGVKFQAGYRQSYGSNV